MISVFEHFGFTRVNSDEPGEIELVYDLKQHDPQAEEAQ